MNNIEKYCENCATPLGDDYCAGCGQAAHSNIRFFGEIVKDLLSSFFSYDSKFNRTIQPLLFKPGFLSVQFIAGRRARFLTPFRLYLFTSVICFLMLSLQNRMNDDGVEIQLGASDAVQNVDEKIGSEANSNELDVNIAGVSESVNDYIEQQASKLVGLTSGQLLELAFNTLPTMMLVLLPILALLMKLLYFGSRRYYVEHLIVVLHSQSFLFIMFTLLGLIEMLGKSLLVNSDWITSVSGTLLLLWAFAYIPLMLKRVYQQSRAVTLMKYAVLLVSYFFLTGFFLVLSFAWNVISL